MPCEWPNPPLAPVHSPSETPENYEALESLFSSASILSKVKLPPRGALRRCYSIFFRYYITNNFCSFVFRSDLEERPDEMKFLVVSIICLCSRHLTPQEASENFRLASGKEVCGHYTAIAKCLARSTSDEPSGKFLSC